MTRAELPAIWTLDRREHIARIYRHGKGELVLEDHNFDVPGWAPGQPEGQTPRLLTALDRGGELWGIFEGERLAAAAVYDPRRLGAARDLVQLEWLHVSRDDRGKGFGRTLFYGAQAFAALRGAAGFYISASPTEHTVNFYRSLGCRLTEPEPDLFVLEPEDIHLEWRGLACFAPAPSGTLRSR